MGEKTKALKAAIPHTLPVFIGFMILGMAYGILMSSKGYGVGWSILMSIFVFAGSMQYVAITALTTVFNPINAFLLTLVVNARHIFYGISMLDRFQNAGKFKPYLIFGLCDETFSVLCSAEPPEGVDRNLFMFFVTVLDHSYWVAGTAIGGILGSMMSFNTKGLDFVLTALFVVIYIGQWKNGGNRKSALIGVGATAVCLILFGRDHFIIPSMIAIMILLAGLRNIIEKPRENEEGVH